MKYLIIVPFLIFLVAMIATHVIYVIKQIRTSVQDQKEDVVRQYGDVLTRHEMEDLYAQVIEQQKEIDRHKGEIK